MTHTRVGKVKVNFFDFFVDVRNPASIKLNERDSTDSPTLEIIIDIGINMKCRIRINIVVLITKQIFAWVVNISVRLRF